MGDRIRTPDQRLRVFVSSTLGELAAERKAARAAVEQLRLAPVMFELGARPHPPRALYRAYLEQSDVFVGIYWQRYGWVAPDMVISGLEDEFRLSDGMPRLLYVKRPAPDMEPRLAQMLAALEADGSASYRAFSDAEELGGLLADDLAVLLAERFDAAEAAPLPTASAPAVPQPATRLVGRDADVDRLAALLRDDRQRLVTLTGVGGIGKTRLALAVLGRTADAWPGGGWFVDLTAISAPDGVVDLVATTLGVVAEGRETQLEAVARRLRGAPTLLVLDNFEHVTAAAPAVADLLQRCPDLAVLVTSRTVLHLRGEQEWPVAPLDIPSAASGVDHLEHGTAVALFVERAREARPTFALTPENAPAVLELCRRLDGLPLALELAAPRVRMMTPAQILSHLETRLDLSGSYADLPERQRTLGATLDWSYALLPQTARLLLGRLGVFSGPFTFDAAEQVCAWDGLDVVDALSVLVDHSLVASAERADGEPAFRMLETVRAYALERLEDCGEAATAYEQLRDYLVAVFRAVGPSLHTREQPISLRRLDAEVGNFMTVFDWIVDRGGTLGSFFESVTETWVFWQVRGHFRRMPDMLPRLQHSPAVAAMTDLDWGAMLFAHSGNLFTAGRYEEVVDFVPEQLPLIRRALGPGEAGLMQLLVGIARPHEDRNVARREVEEAVALLRAAQGRAGLAYGLSHYGTVLLHDGDVEAARRTHEEALQIATDLGDVNMQAEIRVQLAHEALAAGDLAEAQQRLTGAWPLYREIDHREGMGYCLGAMAGLAIAAGEAERGAKLLGAAQAMRDSIGLRGWPLVVELERRYAEHAKAALSEEQFAAAFEQGRRHDPEAAAQLHPVS